MEENIKLFSYVMREELIKYNFQISVAEPDIIKLEFPEGSKVSDDFKWQSAFIYTFCYEVGVALPMMIEFHFFDYKGEKPVGTIPLRLNQEMLELVKDIKENKN